MHLHGKEMALTNLARYERIAPFYDLLDLAFEYRRYRALRPLLFEAFPVTCWMLGSALAGIFPSILRA